MSQQINRQANRLLGLDVTDMNNKKEDRKGTGSFLVMAEGPKVQPEKFYRPAPRPPLPL